MTIAESQVKNIIEAALLAAGQPLSLDRIAALFVNHEAVDKDNIRKALELLQADCENRGVELKEVASGYRIQAKQDYAEWLVHLWEEKPPKYSRALLETLVLIAYRQPITRGEIEDVRGVSVSSHIVKTLQERDWIRVVGHRDVPGRPALYATTKAFLDYFNLASLEELPSLSEIKDLDKINDELQLSKMEQGEISEPGITEAELGDDAAVAAANDADPASADTQAQSAETMEDMDPADNAQTLAQVEAEDAFPEDGADLDGPSVEEMLAEADALLKKQEMQSLESRLADPWADEQGTEDEALAEDQADTAGTSTQQSADDAFVSFDTSDITATNDSMEDDDRLEGHAYLERIEEAVLVVDEEEEATDADTDVAVRAKPVDVD